MVDKIDSNHQPISVWLEDSGYGGAEIRGRKNRKRGKRKGVWTEEGRKKFVEYFGKRDEDWKGVKEGWRRWKRRWGG